MLAGVVVGAGLGMFALDLVKTTIWRNAVAAEYGTTFESTGYNTASLVAIEQATNQTEIFLAPGMCADIFDPEKTWMVQPSTVPTQVPELSVSYTNPVSGEVISEAQSIVGEDGELSPALSATAFMDEPIGMTLHLRHNPSNPIGVATWYDVYADVLSNQLGALVSLGGLGSSCQPSDMRCQTPLQQSRFVSIFSSTSSLRISASHRCRELSTRARPTYESI